MFIQTQDRKSIINTFAVKKFVVTPENQIQAIIELPTKTKAAVIEVLGEYDSDEKRKAVIKGLMFDMRRREQAFKMPKNHKVNLNPTPPKTKAQLAAQAKPQAQAQPAKPQAPEAPALDQPATEAAAPDASAKE